MIVEYMLVKDHVGVHAPYWVEDGGYFPNPDNATYIGWSPDYGKRSYYVPDTVLRLTRQQLVDRVVSISLLHPTFLPLSEEPMSPSEVEDSVNRWCDERNEP